ncbi:hypothetical protein C1645_745347 [Glomus cerebriforme]|uniref:DUF659 domain-containing protein n=1 Tax=Glomus cerebriforme TaxID=658196 RepID=A0A397S2U8_9GLOM|nr:hypothetical protein C1645_745347 [Glomus cerebriforme]
MGGVPANMLKHLREYSKISEEIRNMLHNLDNNKTQNKNKYKYPHVEIADSSDDAENESEIRRTQKSMESFVDKSLFTNETVAIYCQLLYASLSANVPFSFVNDLKVNKLFKILSPSYNLPSRKWINTDVLDKVHEEINNEIEKFVMNVKFLTLSGDG